MTKLSRLENEGPQTTDGDIAVMNLESARRRAWCRFFQDPLREGVAETVVEHEQLTAQFVGDLSALDRLESLVNYLTDDPTCARTMLIRAQVASMMHRFADARHLLTGVDSSAAMVSDVNRLRLNIDQASGTNLDEVLDERRAAARKSGRTEDLIALGALFADLREFAEADRTYRQALQNYQDVSPFPVAWASFQLGVLWGRARCRAATSLRDTVVSESYPLPAGLYKGARPLGRNLFIHRSSKRRRSYTDPGGRHWRSGGALASR